MQSDILAAPTDLTDSSVYDSQASSSEMWVLAEPMDVAAQDHLQLDGKF